MIKFKLVPKDQFEKMKVNQMSGSDKSLKPDIRVDKIKTTPDVGIDFFIDKEGEEDSESEILSNDSIKKTANPPPGLRNDWN